MSSPAAYHVMVMTDSDLYSWGPNPCGQLGLGHTEDQEMPQKVLTLPGHPIELAEGYEHSLILTLDPTGKHLYSCGNNAHGQLGTGRPKASTLPELVSGIPGDIIQISCGAYHSMALLKDGSVYGWGFNKLGQLGLGHTHSQPVPTQLPTTPAGIVKIGCGGNFTMALTREGRLYGWGYNEFGQLGLGGETNLDSPSLISGLGRVVDFMCAYNHVLAVTSEGSLYSWGYNENGELGYHTLDGSTPGEVEAVPKGPGIKKVACGGHHSLVLLRDGSLWSWGYNTFGQLGIGNTDNQSLPVRVKGISGDIVQMKCGSYHSMVVTADDEVYYWGIGSSAGTNEIMFPKNITFLKGNNKKVYFGYTEMMEDIIQSWPKSHHMLSIQNQIEFLILIFEVCHVPKDIIFKLIKLFIQITL